MNRPAPESGRGTRYGRSSGWPLLLLTAALLGGHEVAAQEPRPGEVVVVTCRAAADQTYSCYVPKAYDPKRPWPILYCFAPDARGDRFVDAFRGVCEELGWIVVASMNSQNGPWEPIEAAINAMWADAEARFHLAPQRRYVTGFSGGSRVSFAVASRYPDHITGVLALGAGLPAGPHDPPRKDLLVWLSCGTTDFNHPEMAELAARLEEAGNERVFEVFEGGHVPPAKERMEAAIRWLDARTLPRRVVEFRARLKEAEDHAAAERDVEAWRAIVTLLEAEPDLKDGRKEAEALRKSLERQRPIRREMLADRDLAVAEVWIADHAAKLAESRSSRATARQKLKAIAARYPETEAGRRAGERMKEFEEPSSAGQRDRD